MGHISYLISDFYPYLILTTIAVVAIVFASFKIYKSKASEKRKNILILSLFFVLSFILIFTATEGYFRYKYDESDSLGFLRVNKKWFDRHVRYTAYVGAFFRDSDFDAKKSVPIKIGVMGDSIAFGQGIKNPDDRFSNLLGKKLKEAGKNVAVYNLGVPGLDTEAELKLYHRVKDLNFDILVWEYFINDIQPEDQSTGTPILVKNSQRARILEFISDRSFFLDYLYWRFTSTHSKTIRQLRDADLAQYKNQEVLNKHKETIAKFLNEQKQENKPTIVVIFPSIYLLGPNYQAKFIHEEMGAFFSEHGATVIDLLDDLKDKKPKDLMSNRFDTHPNESVHQLAAQRIYEKVIELLKRGQPTWSEEDILELL